jgi:hypothetical protein
MEQLGTIPAGDAFRWISGDPLFQLIRRELWEIDPRSELAHHQLRCCRRALDALSDRQALRARMLVYDSWAGRDETGARVGRRAMTMEERTELEALRALVGTG